MTPTARLALLDRILAALTEAPATSVEVAERIGTVPCEDGWRPATLTDVAPELDLLSRHGLIWQVGARWERPAPVAG